MKSILDPSFHYTKSIDTDVRKTFARIRREQRRQAELRHEERLDVVRTARGKRMLAA